MQEPVKPQASETDLAVVAICRVIFDALIRGGVPAAYLDNLLAIQQRGLEQQALGVAAGVLGMVRSLLSQHMTPKGEAH